MNFECCLACNVVEENQVPGSVVFVVERIMKAQTTEREKTDTQVFSVYISIASVKEKRVRFSAQLRILSASAAYRAFPCNISQTRWITTLHNCSSGFLMIFLIIWIIELLKHLCLLLYTMELNLPVRQTTDLVAAKQWPELIRFLEESSSWWLFLFL